MLSRLESGKPPTIVVRVALLVAAVLLPVLVLSTFMLMRYSTEQRDRYLAQLQATARAVSLAIDAKVQRQEGIISTLLGSRELRQHDWQGVHEVASLAVASEPDAWVAVYDDSGRFVLATDVPFGTVLPRMIVPAVVQWAVETRHSVVSGLDTRRYDGTKFVGTFVPVIEDGAVTHVLAVALPAGFISQVLRERPMAIGGIGGVIDQNGILIARTIAEEEFVGHEAAADLLVAIRGREEGLYEARSLEGVTLHGAFAKSPVTGWTVALGAEETALNAPLRRTLIQFGGGGAALLFAALALAVYHGRRIARPMTALSRMADALGRGEPLRAEPLYFVEAQNTAQRLREVAVELQERVAERERVAEAARRDRDLLVYYAISSAAEHTLDLQQRLEMSLQAALQSIGLEAGAIYILDAAGEPLLRASVGCSAAFVDDLHAFGLTEDVPAIVAAQKTTLVFDAASCPTPRLRSVLEREQFLSLAGVPLLADVRLVGVLLFATRHKREFLPDEVALLGAVGHQLGMFIDHARLYEATRRELAEREKAQALLETAHKDLESFSYSVSHDLRAPLRAIDGFSRILQEDYADKLDAEGKRVINVVRESTARMTRMIDDVLAFSRVGRAELRIAPVNMQAAVKAAMRDLEPAMAGRQIDLEIGKLPQAQGDPAMLQQVWANLIGNAVKYTGPREQAIIQIMAKQCDGETIYLVRDNGVGFDMRYASKLFGAFERLHGSEFPGTGIGLSIVKRIVTRHGGRIWAEGKVEEGATFFFTVGDGNHDLP
jgi:two-component system sensor kinase